MPDWLIVQLIKQRIDELFPAISEEEFVKQYAQDRKFRRGWILLDFPKTVEQARLLLKELVGFEPHV